MRELASDIFRKNPDPAVRELYRIVEKLQDDHVVMRREHAAAMAMLMSRDAMQTTITNDTVAAITVWEDYGTETIEFVQPDGNVQVFACATSYITTINVSRRVGELQVGISLDGGSTFTFGPKNRAETDRVAADLRSGGIAAFAFVEGEPTGDIVIKAQIQQPSLGSAGDLTWNDGSLYGEFVRMEMEDS